MECLSFFVGPVVDVFKNLWTDKLSNFTSSAKRVKEMENKMKDLERKRDDIQEHVKDNEINNRKIPTCVPKWLKDVEDIKKDFDKIPSNTDCFNLKEKYEAGEDALKLTKKIDDLITQSKEITWTNAKVPLGRVDSSKRPPSTSASGGDTQNGFKSRNKIFNDALKFLQHDDGKTQVIALCGMGGVGKTTLMNQLKKAAEDNKMFKWIVVVVIGKAFSLSAIQNAIAAHTGESLTETDEKLRATLLSKRFQAFSEHKEKSLVILDDVWEKIKLEDIGLASPLPNGVKLLLTSRDVKVCQQIAALEVVEVAVLKENEARDFFCQKAEISAEHDHDLYEIGSEIVKKCGYLPLAIEIIAGTLKCEEDRSVWRCTRDRLKINDNVQEIIEISYKNLKREDKAILLLCGLFPEDSNIPIEDLTRYAWGLKLLKQVSTMGKARDSTRTSVSNLKNAYLLMSGDSHHSDCVRLHDLVLAFAVNTVSKGGEDGCSIIHHEDDFSNWSEANSMSQSCKQISLACKGMSEFPTDFEFPNLTLLKLMQGDESLRFPQDFYVGKEKLQVIAFEELEYPLVPTSFQCSTNLRTLCLDECSLMFDLACIGNLSNLEVLSFANSGITILPSTFGNLHKLRLMDVTGCYNLVIEDGVFKNLVKLEELYMIPYDEKACCFTDNNSREFAERSENLKRFKLSVGCSFTEVRDHMQTDQVDMHSYENSLELVTNIEELRKSKINELFKITDALYLQVNDMNTLEDVDVEFPHPRHPPRNSSFDNLRLLVVSGCAELKYLFTRSVATNLFKLEYLEISSCDAMEAVIHTENNGSDIIMFSKLKYLRLAGLRKLLCFCNNINVIELPRLMELQLVGLPKITSIYTDSATSFVSSNISPTQSFLNKEDATPKLEKLFVKDCDSIEVLFNMDFGEIEQLSSSLRSIKVDGCNSLVKLFSCNPFPFFNNLQELEVRRCRSIQVLFEIDSGRAGRYEEQDAAPKLEKLVVSDMENLKEIWPPKFSISNLCPLRELKVEGCGSIEVLFNMDFGETEQPSSLRSIKVKRCHRLEKLFSCNPFPFLNNLKELNVERCGSIQVLFNTDLGRAGKSEEQVCSSSLRSIKVERCDSLVNLLPSNPMPLFNNLEELTIMSCASIVVLFSMDFGEIEQPSSLRSIEVTGCDSLGKLFSCNPFPFLNNLQELTVESCRSIQVLFNTELERDDKSEEQVCSSSLRSIKVSQCRSLVKLFSCYPFPFLNNLQELKVKSCGSIQVLFDTDLRRAGKSEGQVCSSSLRSIQVSGCASLVNLLPSNPMPLFNHLEELKVTWCASVEVIFDIDMGCVGEMDKVSSSRLRSIDLKKLGKLREVWRIKDAGNNLIHGFEAVESIHIEYCERFENLITPATTTFDMRALKEVEIMWCGTESGRNNESAESNEDEEINVIPTSREEVNDGISKVALPSSLLPTFHHLHELVLDDYKGVEVVFEITTPSSRESPHNTQQPPILPYLEELQLKYMGRMSHVWKCDWNEFLILQKPQSHSSFHNLTTITMYKCNSIKYLFSPLMAKLLSNLKKIDISYCNGIEEIVSNRDDADVSIYSHTTTTFFPNLDILKLKRLRNLKCIGGGANGISTDIHNQLKSSQASWSWCLCQNNKEISITDCDALSSVVPWYAVGQMQKLQVLEIINCKSMTEVFQTQEINNKMGTHTGKSLPRLEYITMLKLPKLKILKIKGCNLLEHIFTFSTLQSLTQLEELVVKDCKAVEVIVKKESGEQKTTFDDAVFPHLKSLKVVNLPNFVGFFLGKNEFIWPALEKVVIRECPQITVFTYGQSTSLKLKFINTSLGKHSVECGLNFHVTSTSHQARLPSYESTSSYRPTTMEWLPWSYHNLIEADMVDTSGGQTLFSSDKLLLLQKLETIHCSRCRDTEEIFDSQTDAEFPNLKQVDLYWLDSLKYIWKSKQGSVLKFPNLTRLSIERCQSLEYVFTCPMVGSLLQLQELNISWCQSMKVIVKGEEEECDAIVNAIVEFPCLKSLKLEYLWSLNGFCLGKEAFEFPSLDTLQIDGCQEMTVFTKGDLSAPKLYAISIGSGYYKRKYNIHNRLNLVIKDFTRRVKGENMSYYKKEGLNL